LTFWQVPAFKAVIQAAFMAEFGLPGLALFQPERFEMRTSLKLGKLFLTGVPFTERMLVI
jgi:hypothetical protein